MIPSVVDYFPAGNIRTGRDVLRQTGNESAVNSSPLMPRKMRPQAVKQSQKSLDSTPASRSRPNGRIEALRMLSLALSRQIAALGELTEVADSGFKLGDEVRRFEADMIRIALLHTNGGQRSAARLLGMKITTLHRKIKHYKINIEQVKTEAELLHITEK